MNSNITCILQSLFQRHWKMLTVETKLWKVCLKNIRDLGTVTPVTMVMLMSVLMLEI